MPRELTDQETSYLANLAQRNILQLKSGENEEIDTSPNQQPMSNAERQRRYRIRKKAVRMARDLSLIYLAGISPELGGDLIKDASELLDRMMNLLIEEVDEDNELETWWKLKGGEPGTPASEMDTSYKPKTSDSGCVNNISAERQTDHLGKSGTMFSCFMII